MMWWAKNTPQWLGTLKCICVLLVQKNSSYMYTVSEKEYDDHSKKMEDNQFKLQRKNVKSIHPKC